MQNRILLKDLNNFLYGMNERGIEEDYKSEITNMIQELEEEILDLEGIISENETEIEEIKEDRDIWRIKFYDMESDYNELIQ